MKTQVIKIFTIGKNTKMRKHQLSAYKKTFHLNPSVIDVDPNVYQEL